MEPARPQPAISRRSILRAAALMAVVGAAPTLATTPASAAAGSKIALLGAGTYGAQGGTFTVNCSDGTTLTQSLTLDDWCAPAPTIGDAAAATTQYLNTPTGALAHTATVWRADIPINSAKSVAPLQLPAGGAPPAACRHIFAVTVAA